MTNVYLYWVRNGSANTAHRENDVKHVVVVHGHLKVNYGKRVGGTRIGLLCGSGRH